MLRLLPLPIFICIYLFSWWRCKKNIIASDKQLNPCIDWAYIKNLPLPPKPSFLMAVSELNEDTQDQICDLLENLQQVEKLKNKDMRILLDKIVRRYGGKVVNK